jgi:hypothetical protein
MHSDLISIRRNIEDATIIPASFTEECSLLGRSLAFNGRGEKIPMERRK